MCNVQDNAVLEDSFRLFAEECDLPQVCFHMQTAWVIAQVLRGICVMYVGCTAMFRRPVLWILYCIASHPVSG